MKQLLEKMAQFAGQAVGQKPGEQWKGDDPNPPGKKLVGDSIIKDLSTGPTPKTKEQELAEEWAAFNEDDLGVTPKRPGRKSDRPGREYVKNGAPSKRYNAIKDKGLTEYRVQVDNFTADDIKELEGIRDLATVKARAFQLVSTPSKRPMKPEKVAWFKQAIESKTNTLAVIKLMWDLLLSGEGQQVIGSRHSMSSNSYRSRFNESEMSELDIELQDYRSLSDEKFKAAYGITKAEWMNKNKSVVIQRPALRKGLGITEGQQHTFYDGDRVELVPPYVDVPGEVYTVSQCDNERQRCWISDSNGYGWYATFDQLTLAADEDELDEGTVGGSAQVHTVNIVKRSSFGGESRTRTTSGTLPELLEYFGYTLEVGQSYEHERGRKKINMNPKNIQSLVDNLNKAQSNAARNGHSSTYYEVAVNEGWNSDPGGDPIGLSVRREIDPDGDDDWRTPNVVIGYKIEYFNSHELATDEIFPTYRAANDYINAHSTKENLLAATAVYKTNETKKSRTNEGIESSDPIESAVLAAVQELIQQGHTEVAPEVITNMVVATTSQPFLLKDLVDANNNSQAIQHYVDSINPTKVKFSSDILTVKNEDPMKEKQAAQNGVAKMAAKAAGRSRLGESGDTPLRDKEDYDAKLKALQDLQLAPSTHKDPQLKAELVSRLGRLNRQYADLQSKLREFKESRGHKAIATKLGNMDRMNKVQIPTPEERREQMRLRREKEEKEQAEKGKSKVVEYGANNPPQGTTPQVNNPKQAQTVAQATQTLKTATGSSAPTTNIAKALDSASQGKPVGQQDMKAIEPLMKDIATIAQDPKLAGQFKNVLNQAQQTQLKQQQT